MLNKDRYNFDQRFNHIAEKILTFNGVIPSGIEDNEIQSKPTNFEQYQMQNDPDYQLLKQGNFNVEQNQYSSNNYINQPISQPTTMAQYLTYQQQPYQYNQIQPQANIYPTQQHMQQSNYYTPQVRTKKKENIRQFVNNLDEDQLDLILKNNLNIISNNGNANMNWQNNNINAQNMDPMLINDNIENEDQYEQEGQEQVGQKDRQQRSGSVPLATGEMILQQQKMFEQLQMQQYQFQQQLLHNQQEEQMRRQRKKHKKQRQSDIDSSLQPLIQNQQIIMQAILQKVEQRKNHNYSQPSLLNEDILFKELEYRRKIQQQQHELQLQKMEQEKSIAQQNIQLQNMIIPNLMAFNPYQSAIFPSNLANQTMPMGSQGMKGFGGMPQMMVPPMGGQQNQINNAPKLKEMQQLLFAKPKTPRSVVVEGILRDMKK